MGAKPPINRGMTTIQITRETKARLAKFGNKGDTYEGILIRLLESKSRKK